MTEKTDADEAGTPDTAPEVVQTYKGFDLDWKCRDFQYEVGQSYEHTGPVAACAGGFHACEYPLDVLRYYAPANSRFAVVEQSGDLSRHHEDTKVASRRITVKAEISLPGLIQAAIDWTFSKSTKEEGAHTGKDCTSVAATGDSGAASATGTGGAASATGYRGAASATGYRGAASATGYSGAASATGDSGAASATGTGGAASATGDSGAASATGYRGAASATGTGGAASATGDSGAASATGTGGAASATGDSGAASATGTGGAASATGTGGAASATGTGGAAMASGRFGRAMGAEGCALFLVERDGDWKIVHAWAGIAGQDGIKPLVWYTLENGKPVEVA